MYQNIVTDKPQTYSRYLVIGEYKTLEEAKKNYKADVKNVYFNNDEEDD